MAVTDRYAVYKKWKDVDINSIRNFAGKYSFVDAFKIGLLGDSKLANAIFDAKATLGDFNRDRKSYEKQKSDYNKTFGSTMLAGESYSVGSAVVNTGSVPVNRTEPLISTDTGFTGKKKKKSSDASALGL